MPAGICSGTVASGFVVRVAERGDADLGAERRVREGDVHARDEVGAVALEARIFLDLDLDVEIAGRRPGGPGMPCPGTRSFWPAVDAGGKADDDLARLSTAPRPFARLAVRP